MGVEINDFKELTYTGRGLDSLKHDIGDHWASNTERFAGQVQSLHSSRFLLAQRRPALFYINPLTG